MTLDTVDDLHRSWAGAGVTEVEAIDASAVAVVDTAGMQLLVALVLELGRSGRRWSWSGVSEPVRQAAERLGLSDVLFVPSPSAPQGAA